MSQNLDKSLDEIIGKRPNRATRGNKNTRKVSKQVNTNRRQGAPSNRVRQARGPVRAPANVVSRLLNTTSLTKVNVEGLPRDIKQSAVREFFANQVGGVQGVLLSYNERGQSTGMANITFRNSEQAKKAVIKFNGAPIDGGRSKLKLNLLIDPTRPIVQDLAQRIGTLPMKNSRNAGPRQSQVRGPQHQNQNQVRGPQKVRGPNKKVALAKKAKQQPKREKPVKKSLDDLDKEMADYFEEKK